MLIPVAGNILIKALPVLDAEGNEVDILAQGYRRWEIVAMGEKVEIPVQIGDIVLLNKANRFLPLDEVVLVHFSAIFAIEKRNES